MTTDITTAAAPIIRVENLDASYNGTPVLRDITFDVLPGEIFFVLGRSGSGKTTLLKQMIGLLEPDRGRILIDGDDITSIDGPPREDCLRKFGVTFQTGALFGSMSLLENVALGLQEFTTLPRDAVELIATMKLDLVGLRDDRHRMPAELSGGMQKRAAIARAIAMDPRILFMDEPAAGLDPVTLSSLDDLVHHLARTHNMTFVIVTHELRSLFNIGDRAIVLDPAAHTIAASGTPAELRGQTQNPSVWEFFHQEQLAARRQEREEQQ